MAGYGGEDCYSRYGGYGGWVGSLETADQPNVTVGNPTPQPSQQLLPGTALHNSTTLNYADYPPGYCYDRLNPLRMYANVNPAYENVCDGQSIETVFSRLNLSTPSRTSDQFPGTSSGMELNNGFPCAPSYYYPSPSQSRVNNELQSELESSRIVCPVSGQHGLLERNRGLPPYLLSEGPFENNYQYRNVQNGSRRNCYPEPNRSDASCFHTCNGFSRPGDRNHLSRNWNHGYPSTSRLDLGSPRSGGRSVNGDLWSQRSGGRSINIDLWSERSGGRSVNGDLGSQRSGGRSVNGNLGSQRSGGRSVNGSNGYNTSVSLSSLSENLVLPMPSSHRRTYSLEELRGRVCSVARDPQARCFLEEKVGEGDPAYIELIFSEVKNDLSDLIVDHSANHLLQKLVVVLNEDQMTDFIRSIISSDRRLLAICDDGYGTYVMQKLLEGTLTPMHKSWLVSSLKNIAVILSKSQHGHHVIMHCLRRFSNEFTVDLVEEMIVNCVDLATNKSGCCVLQHCLEHVNDGHQKACLIAEIVANALLLAGDAFGNYVIQNILDNIPEVVNDIVAQLAGNFYTLSMCRFGSNVVEKCLKNAGLDQSTIIMHQIIMHPNVLDVVKDNYGNFVIQSIWKLSQGRPSVRLNLYRLIQSKADILSSHLYGRRVVQAVLGNIR